MLKQRVITALIIAPILIAIILWLPLFYQKLFFGLLILLAAWEWSKLSGLTVKYKQVAYLLFMVLALFLLDYYHVKFDLIHWVAIIAIAWWTFITILIITYHQDSKNYNRFISVSLMVGLVTMLLAWISITDLHARSNNGPFYILYVCCLVSAADVGAYFIGRRFGKKALAPKLSPGKTVAGLVGGLLSVFVLSGITVMLFDLVANEWLFILLSLVVAVFSVIGDLFESLVKRVAGVKDSGSILPGHGGVLDRVDSAIAAFPIFLVGSIWLL